MLITSSPSEALYNLATGHYVSRALLMACRLDLADILKDGRRHFTELADITGVKPQPLKRVMRLLSSVGVFVEEEDGYFALTAVGERLREGVSGSSRNMVMHFASERIQENWTDLEYCVRTGEPAYRRRGITAPYADPRRTSEDTAIFDAAIADLTRLVAAAVASAYEFPRFATVVDVGGGNGDLMLGLLQTSDSLRGVVIDRPEVIDRANERIIQSGFAGRCSAAAGDFFNEVPGGGDVYILKHVLHNWDDERATAILKTCHRAMTPQARLLTVEAVDPSRIDESAVSRRAAANDVNMLVSTGGRERSEAEFRSLYEAAGLNLVSVIPTSARLSLIEGVP